MTNKSYPHEVVAWAKQRLDDVDVVISEVEKNSSELKESSRKESEVILARLQASRLNLRSYLDKLQTNTDSVRHDVQEIEEAFEAEWLEVEAAFQSFLTITGGHAEAVRHIISARAQAQRRSWEASLQALRDRAAEAVETAGGELDAAIKRLSNEAEKFQARIGEAKNAGDESWKAVKTGVAEAKVIHDRTVQKIKEAFSGLF